MNLRSLLYLLWLIPLLVVSCKSDDDMGGGTTVTTPDPGAIFVTVRFFNQVIEGATITTNPSTQVVQTGSTGSILINDIPPGIYQICATHPSIGSGAASATVVSGEAIDVNISLIEGAFEAPMVSFLSPTNQSVFDLGADIPFALNVSDESDNSQDISLEWRSSIDGVFSTQSASSNGLAQLTTNVLSEGDHVIEVEAKDSDDNVGLASLNISVANLPNAVTLNPVQTTVNNLDLSWSSSDEPDFSNYRVYRSSTSQPSFEVIEVISDVNTTSYVDNNIQVFSNYNYQIGVVLSNGEESLSNIESGEFIGESIDVGTQVEKMIVDPTRPFIYALDKVNNSLLFINKDLKELVKTIFVGSSPTDLDLSLDGDLLYIANFGSSEITVVNLDVQEVGFTFFVDTQTGTWDGNPYRLVTMAGNRMAFTSEDQWNSIKLVDGTSGSSIQTIGSVYQPDLLTNPAGTVLYVAESGSSGSQLIRYNLQGGQLTEVDVSPSSSSTGRIAVISGDGEYIFYQRKKILASNLQSIVGSFSENIYATNEDGSIAIGDENYFDGNNFSIKGSLPLNTRVMAFDTDNQTVFLYDEVSSKIIIFETE